MSPKRVVLALRNRRSWLKRLVWLAWGTCYLLDRQIRQLEKAFLEEGGLRERMTRARLRERDLQRQKR